MVDLYVSKEHYLGFVSFAYYVQFHGYELHKVSNDHLAVYRQGNKKVHWDFELISDCPHAKCGYVYVGPVQWGVIYTADPDLAQCLHNYCWRVKGRIFPEHDDWHCHIDNPLKGNIDIELNSGGKIVCKQKKIIPAP